ncbi:M23 family metallopeptidase [Hyphomonas sp.]|uniref:M23 family metallopeptidase n=1 Tax=Hyphomonas sp. TaxID=87 RepID=UPI0030F9C385
MRILRWFPLAILIALLALQVSLQWLDPATRVVLWHVSQLYMPLAGLLCLIGALIYLAVRKRWASRLGWITLALSCLTLAAPFLPMLLGQAYPARLASTQPVLAIRVPLDGPVRVAWGGDTVVTNYHAAYPDQRWAYDLIIEPGFTGSDVLEDYGCYGKPVLAPVSGTVAVAHDGEPEQVPGKLPLPPKQIMGNHVMIQTEPGRNYLVIAHLKPGSVAVSAGDTVQEGDLIGACGNSGNTSEPHVHVHYAHYLTAVTQQPLLGYGLPLYFRDNEGPDMPKGGFETQGGKAVPKGDIITHTGPATLP